LRVAEVGSDDLFCRIVRVVVLGAGGIGGVIGGRLHQHGHEVVLIARGAHLEAMRSSGLRLEDPDETVTLSVVVVGSPAEVAFRHDDVVLLATKTQDAAQALADLHAVAPAAITVACATNGVEAERIALRLFPNVLGVNVMMPTAFLEPGVVQVISAPIGGSLDVGRYPSGENAAAIELAAMLASSRFLSVARPDVMRAKYRKLILNTGNAVEAACGRSSDAAKELVVLAAREAEQVLAAAGIDVATEDEEAAQRGSMRYRPINGRHRGGGSTWQSIVTGRSIETDYLNGEIVLVARSCRYPAPINEALQRAMNELVRTGGEPGSMDAGSLLQSPPLTLDATQA
jgi:2-dehydropantoate 2-reductase